MGDSLEESGKSSVEQDEEARRKVRKLREKLYSGQYDIDQYGVASGLYDSLKSLTGSEEPLL